MLVAQSSPTLCDPMGCNLLGSSFHEFLQARILECVSGLLFPSSDDLPNPGIEPRSFVLQADALTSELWGSPYDLFESENHSVMSNFLQSHGILQARILEWVAIPFFRESSQPMDQTQVSLNAGRFFLPAEPLGSPISSLL